MTDDVKEKLGELIKTQGQKVLDDPKKFTAFMLDACSGTHEREINILTISLTRKIPQQLQSSGNQMLTGEVRAYLSNRLKTDCALQADAACWAVDAWAGALGMVIGEDSGIQAAGKPHPPSAPVLELNCTVLDFKKVVPGTTPSKTFKVGNFGTGTLMVKFNTTEPWIKVSPAVIDVSHSWKAIKVTVDSSFLPLEKQSTGYIDIQSNAGSSGVEIKAVVYDKPKIVFRAWMLAPFVVVLLAALGLFAGPFLMPPPAPVLGSPANSGADVPCDSPVFTWSASAGANKYRIMIAGDDAFLQIVQQAEIAGTSYTYPGKLDPGKTYYWSVQAIKLTGGDWSNYRRFATKSQATSPAVNVPPIQQPSIPGKTVLPKVSFAYKKYDNAEYGFAFLYPSTMLPIVKPVMKYDVFGACDTLYQRPAVAAAIYPAIGSAEVDELAIENIKSAGGTDLHKEDKQEVLLADGKTRAHMVTYTWTPTSIYYNYPIPATIITYAIFIANGNKFISVSYTSTTNVSNPTADAEIAKEIVGSLTFSQATSVAVNLPPIQQPSIPGKTVLPKVSFAYKKYDNAEYGFSFLYPSTMSPVRPKAKYNIFEAAETMQVPSVAAAIYPVVSIAEVDELAIENFKSAGGTDLHKVDIQEVLLADGKTRAIMGTHTWTPTSTYGSFYVALTYAVFIVNGNKTISVSYTCDNRQQYIETAKEIIGSLTFK